MFFTKEEIKSFNTKEFNFLIVKICDHHLEITLNRPEKKNALNTEMINELALCTDYANHEDSIRAVIYKSNDNVCLLYTSPSPRDPKTSRMPSSA